MEEGPSVAGDLCRGASMVTAGLTLVVGSRATHFRTALGVVALVAGTPGTSDFAARPAIDLTVLGDFALPRSLPRPAELDVRAEEFLGAVLKTAAQPLCVFDHDGVIRFVNPAAVAALGYDEADELLGRQSHEAIHERHSDGSPSGAGECPMLMPQTTGETVHRELDWFFRRSGSMLPVSYVSAPIAMTEGRGAVVAFTDIQDRLHAQQQASLRRVATIVAARHGVGRGIHRHRRGGRSAPGHDDRQHLALRG